MDQGKQWSSYIVEDVEKRLSSNFESGLFNNEVLKRRERYGKNILEDTGRNYFLGKLYKQFKNPLVLILLSAGVVTFILGAYVDTTVIFIALSINIIIDIFQEGRSSRAFDKLKESQQKYAFVLREGKKQRILSEELVKGDVIFLDAGVSVPADARLIKDNGITVNEAALTGEWIDVSKDSESIIKSGPITGQVNMVWMGTLVSSGNATAVVVATGRETEIGAIAESLLSVVKGITPLQKSIRNLARFLAKMILIVIVVLVAIGILGGESVGNMLLLAVAIAVAAIPEGLPAAVTVVLAFGMESILKKNGLVRNLLAAETLGSTTVILTDKTGTLTEAKMKAVRVVSALELSKSMKEGAQELFALHNDDERTVLSMALSSSGAFIEWKEDEIGSFQVRGNPVERAIVSASIESGINKKDQSKEETRIDFVPFQSVHRFSASLSKITGKKDLRMVIVGAPELVLEKISSVLYKGKSKKIDDHLRDKFFSFQKHKSKQGLRMIAVAYKTATEKTFKKETKHGSESLEGGFVFGGFILLDDPIRADVKEAISTAQESGIRVIMATGDYPETANRIALDVGIQKKGGAVRTGSDIEEMSDKELALELEKVNVFARVLPHQKLRIVKILKGQGEVVAMTGDGINDAPALRSADIGIALGSGTDVAKEASDLILLDNGFDIIVYAVEEGRRIVDNLKKITAYLLSTGFSEIIVVGGALIVGAPLPLLPAQILWINIIEEGLMNFAFAFEPKEKGLMKRNPRDAGGKILTPQLKKLIFSIAAITGVFLVALYFVLLQFNLMIDEVRTIMFLALSIDSIFFAFSLKDLHTPIWKINIFSNRYLIGALIINIGVLFIALTLPFIQNLLSLTPFTKMTFVLLLGFGFFNLLVIELVKYFIFGGKENS